MDAPAPAPFLFRYSTRRVIYGPGTLASLADIAHEHDARRTVLVSDSFFAGSATEARVRFYLDGVHRTDPSLWVHAVPNREPDTDSVTACHALMREVRPDLVVALGGGSTMDTAKVARIMLANPGTAAEVAGFDRRLAPHPSLLVCVPTTAGTASEVSEMAVISQAGSDIKLRYRSQNLSAAIAILDPELLLSMPAQVTAHTGFDAFTHAFEAYTSKLASPLTDPLAWSALEHLVRWLPAAFASPEDLDARGHCLIGSTLAGMVFNSTQLGLAHAIAAPLGALHHVAHGLANALALPAVAAFNEPALGDKGRAVATLLDAPSAALGIARLRARLALDLGLGGFVADAAARETLAEAALESGNIPSNARAPVLEDVRAVLAAMHEPLREADPATRLAGAYAGGAA